MKKLFLTTGIAAISFYANAQTQYADKIIATVGSKVILQSEIGKQYLGKIESDKVELPEYEKCGMLRDAIAAKIMVAQADRDSIMVTQQEVESAVDEQISRILLYEFRGDKNAMERTVGKSIYQIKEEYREPLQEQLVYRKMYMEVVKDVAVTPKEVETFYNQIPEEQKVNIPASVEVGEIVLKPEVDPEIEKYTRERVEDIRKQIVDEGRPFETMAQIYSEDDGAQNGGEMNLNRKDGNYDSRFVAAAFKLQPGEVSPVFRSSFGYHLVKMLERNGDDAKIRYIVIIPKNTASDYDKAIAKLDSVRNLLVSSKLSFGEALNKVSNDDRSKQQGGMVRDMSTGSTILSLDAITSPDLAMEVTKLEVGEYSKPYVYTDEMDRSRKVRIIYLKSKTPPHKMNLKDDYTMIQNAALQMKKMNFLMSWLEDKKDGYYIKIDPNYVNSCEELNIFTKKK